MAWTDPTTRTTGELITASIWNTDIVDNLIELKEPATLNSALNEGADYTTSATSFADIDATNGKLRHVIDTAGGDLLCVFHGMIGHNNGTAGAVNFNISVNSVDEAADSGLGGAHLAGGGAAINFPVTIVHWIIGLAAGNYDIRLRWRTSAAGITATLYSGAGTTQGRDVHPEFTVREVS